MRQYPGRLNNAAFKRERQRKRAEAARKRHEAMRLARGAKRPGAAVLTDPGEQQKQSASP